MMIITSTTNPIVKRAPVANAVNGNNPPSSPLPGNLKKERGKNYRKAN